MIDVVMNSDLFFFPRWFLFSLEFRGERDCAVLIDELGYPLRKFRRSKEFSFVRLYRLDAATRTPTVGVQTRMEIKRADGKSNQLFKCGRGVRSDVLSIFEFGS